MSNFSWPLTAILCHKQSMKTFITILLMVSSQISMAQEICQSVKRLRYVHRPEAACPQVEKVCAESGRGELKLTEANSNVIAMNYNYKFRRALSDIGEYIYSSYGDTFSYSALVEHKTDNLYPATELPGLLELELWIFETKMPDNKTQVCYYELAQD